MAAPPAPPEVDFVRVVPTPGPQCHMVHALEQIEAFKEKLTSKEYMDVLNTLRSAHSNIKRLVRIHYVDVLAMGLHDMGRVIHSDRIAICEVVGGGERRTNIRMGRISGDCLRRIKRTVAIHSHACRGSEDDLMVVTRVENFP